MRGIELVPGVEISVSWGDTTLHVVGLRIDPSEASIREGLEGIRPGASRARSASPPRWGKLGVEGTFAGAYALAENKTMLGRTHFARHLANTGVVKDIQAAFDKYLAKGKPAYVAHRWASLEDAVRWISRAAGRRCWRTRAATG
jgi:predicted metal-dependent phosphoesterase TrpH